MIPQRIHQTAKTSEIPEKWRAYQQRVRDFHPGWEYQLWTDEDNIRFVRSDFPEWESMYLNLPKNIMRADVIRYMLMFRFGGWYLDLDYEMLRPFPQVQVRMVLPRESSDSEPVVLGNSIFASEPGEKFWMDALQDVASQGLSPSRLVLEDEVIAMTAPGLLTRVYHRGHSDRNDIYVPPQKAFNPPIPASVEEYERTSKDGSIFGIHHCTGSWRALTFGQRLRAKIRRFLGKND